MKKTNLFIPVLIVVISIFGCGKKSENVGNKGIKSDRDNMEIKGDISSVRTTIYKAKENFGTLEKTEFISDNLEVFDNNGFLIGHYVFDKDGRPTVKAWKKGDKYMDSGQAIGADGSITGRYSYEHDSRGNLAVVSFFTPDGTLSWKTNKAYDQYDNITEETRYGSDGEISTKETWLYNTDGKLVENKEVNRQGRQISRTEYEYDTLTYDNPNGDYSSSTEYDNSDIPVSTRKYSYDFEGNIIIEVASNGETENTFTYEYKYDENKNWTQIIYKKNSVIYQVTERQFNVSVPSSATALQEAINSTSSGPAPTVKANSNKTGYPATNVLDGNPATAWVAAEDGSGSGEYLYFNFPKPRDIANIVIVPGYNKSEEAWISNNRLESILVEYSGSTDIKTFNFDGKRKSQSIPINRQKVEWIKITVSSTYPGSKWKDTCISDISFY